ncbi:MAG: polysaccharide deacetylase family protein [Nitrospiraceae bacterium]|nr:polysaccharide deacetylase family protein [Nitrospiraceae bacterium]
MRPIPVLMYHHINPHKGDMVTVRPEVFEGQMEYLHRAGYKTLKMDELLSYINGELKLQQKAAVVTFDDGWLDNYIYAFPVLKKYTINAAVFVITDRTERASENKTESPAIVPTHNESKLLIEKNEDYKVVLNWELIKEMSDSGIVEIYSHTKSHKKCNGLSKSELLEELSESKKTIEKRLGKPCPYLCWPYGKYNETALRIAQEAGYKAIFTTHHGIVKKDSDPFAIKRIVVKDSVAWLKKRMLIYTNPVLSEFYLKIKKK